MSRNAVLPPFKGAGVRIRQLYHSNKKWLFRNIFQDHLIFFAGNMFENTLIGLEHMKLFSSRLSTYTGDRLLPHIKNSGTNHFVQAYDGKP